MHINLLIATLLGGPGKAPERQGEEPGELRLGAGALYLQVWKYFNTLTTGCISTLEVRHFWNSPISEDVWNHVKNPPTYNNVQKDSQPP